MRLQLGARQYPAERSGEPTGGHAPAVVQRPGHRHGAATGRGQLDLGGRGSAASAPAKLYARARGFAFDGEAAEVMQSEGTRVTVQDTPVADAWPGRFPGPRLSPDVADLNTRAGGSRSVSLPMVPRAGMTKLVLGPIPSQTATTVGVIEDTHQAPWDAPLPSPLALAAGPWTWCASDMEVSAGDVPCRPRSCGTAHLAAGR